MSGINRSRAAGKSRGRGTDDDITRPTTPAKEDSEHDTETGGDNASSGASSDASGPGRRSAGSEDVAYGKDTADDRTDDPSREQPSKDESSKGSRGRPSTIRSPHRTTVTLEEDHVDYLDNAAARIKLAGGEKLSRGAIIRAVLSAVMESDLDLSEAQNEERLERLLVGSLTGRPPSGSG
jgi:hypothetical protein